MFKEFKEFAMKGSLVDMAIAFVMGGAFGKIVTSFVNDILMPPIGLLLGGVDFTNLYAVIKGQRLETLEATQKAGGVTINYGLFINGVLDFLIVAFVIFLVVKAFNRMQRKPAPAPAAPTTKDCPYCQTSIPIKAVRCPNCTSELKN